ncbi:alpha/beta fold hydrolase [Kribbella sp. CA-247076]|uniref:alpha/beta fold hydrolase n=1 Tax=Kribbella sp. CA-247076 TaxID=3239941 RepID=UPI003D8C8D64
MTNYVTSTDGTSIAYDRLGSGPNVILVGGGLDDGRENEPLAAWLATDFSVFNYARRGRGRSGDTPPYAVERELEDLEALLAEAGGTAHLFGASSGGALALRAAAAGLPVDRIAVYDVPYCLDDETYRRAQEYVTKVGPAVAEGRLDDALELFLWLAGSAPEEIHAMKAGPYWPAMREVAHTLAAEAACLGDHRPPKELAAITRPVLAIDSGQSAGSPGMAGLPKDFFAVAADAIADLVPQAERRTLADHGHVGAPDVLGPVLKGFFH